ncbi:hypothetical protein HaLaN_11314 [Haematococcus lacustris]|uniref:Uncharacterized protein n=1 Tax=Haematococcus lacustris TaxID=44745 RepID=A0A699YXY3_HAELA|nr:hypothetical protein HaLaN_11314 [Haematococcus lacustris]
MKGKKREGSGLADERAFQFDPATQMGMGLDPGAIQAVSAASGVSQVQHDSGLIQARHNTQRWNDNIKPELQHLAAATPAGTSLVATQRHVAVTLATWDAVWEEYRHANGKPTDRVPGKVVTVDEFRTSRSAQL